jgi:prepilin-type processing-associated H-X9-DG protein
VFYYMLPYIDQQEVFDQIDSRYYYNSLGASGSGSNVLAAQKAIATFLCPTNSLRPRSGVDALGYGYTDYGATVYCDIDPAFDSTQAPSATNAMRNKDWRADGGLHYGGSTVGQIRDGLSKTVAIAEDPRNEFMPGAYPDPASTATGNWAAVAGSLPAADSIKNRAFWRWVEPDASGFGVSGASNQISNTTNPAAQRVINNNSLPTSVGPSDCLWNKAAGNCGPNDEIFSFHGDGANVVFMDGHVTFLDQNIDPVVMRRLVTAYEGIPLYDPPSYPSTYTTAVGGQVDTPVNTGLLKTVEY